MNMMRWAFAAVSPLVLGSAVGVASPPTGEPGPRGWDFSSPVNISETREYLGLMYAASDAGASFDPLSYTFTNERPESEYLLILPAVEVFNRLYEDRLDPLGHGGKPYNLLNLMADDPAVSSRFRRYVLTGEIETDDGDQSRFGPHLAMALEALSKGEDFAVGAVWLEGGKLISVDLRPLGALATTPGTPTPPTVTPTAPFDCDLEAWVRRSLLQCMTDKGLYKSENPGGVGRFDCDDFADAMAEWLLRHLRGLYPSIQVEILFFAWQCPGQDPVGHAMPIVIHGGKFYLIDPYTGEKHGPYDSLEQAWQKALELFMRCTGGTPIGTPVTYPPGDRSLWPREPKPWWHYEDMQQRFCRILKECCKEIPAYGTPPAGCTPQALPDGTVPGVNGPAGCSICDYVPRRTWISPNACGNVSCP